MKNKPHTRIALISEHASPLAALGSVDSGGQNVYVTQLARHLPQHGFAIDVFTRRDSDALPEVVQWMDNVRIIHVPAGPACFVSKEKLLPFMADFTNYLIRYSQKQPYDLLHANFWLSALAAADVKKATGIPFVVTFHALGKVRRRHQGQADGFPDERFAIEERVVQEADRLIAECPQEKEDLVQLYGANPARITIIPGGFDPQEFAPMNQAVARQAVNLPLDELLILQLGRMVPRKGVANVIRSLTYLKQVHDVVARLVVVGGEAAEPDPALTPEIGRLQAIAAQEGVTHQVTFVGQRGRDILKYYYNAADVFVSTPWYEPFGITPLEAMACGTAVVGSRVGGIQFSICEDETGFLVPAKDPAALAHKVALLLKDADLRQRMGQAGIRRVNELFTWTKSVEAVADLYSQLIGPKEAKAYTRMKEMDLIDQGFVTSLETLQTARRELARDIHETAQLISSCFQRGRKLLICGNGGSAAEAQHLAAELVGRFKLTKRPGLPALALTADTAVLTAWSNDIGYDDVFARQVQAFGSPGDLLLGISTSGHSPNLRRAFQTAHWQGLTCLALLGGDGGELAELTDKALIIPSTDTQRIQEAQLLVLHLLCELVELWLPEWQAAGRRNGHGPSSSWRERVNGRQLAAYAASKNGI